MESSKNSHERHGDSSAEAMIDIASRLPRPLVVVPNVRQQLPLCRVTDGKGRRVDRADHDLWIADPGCQVRQIDIPERPWRPRSRDEIAKDGNQPARGARPVERVDSFAMVVRNGDS